ncbi:lytic transglycosylase domain-containing protein [Candidatus Berkelbacteria bacterium]|nr:lytic transglycosylase domain-containing protein [Candidatus Berkelbacteria bacterium]MBI4029958.1 lytic transglycosylase domain-containing protein [Candidatus Berkelbacteria bacterium]
MRKRVIIFSIILVVTLGGLIFYRFFPEIWGEAVYPLEHEEVINRSASEFGIDPTLIAAVIFRESRFHETSVSRAGARGLMQIVPGTGAGIAKRLGVTNFSADLLFDPVTNIRFGTSYLRTLYDSYGSLDLVLAAYNGGGAAANRLKESGNYNLIPRETYFFINNVKSAQEMYAKVYSDRLKSVEGAAPLTPTTISPTPVAPAPLPPVTLPSSIWQKPLKDILNTVLF